MEKETSTSKNKLIAKFIETTELIKEKYDVNIWLVEILGRRWSYIAGEREDSPLLPPECTQLNERFGVVSNNWERIPPEERENIISSLKKIIETYG